MCLRLVRGAVITEGLFSIFLALMVFDIVSYLLESLSVLLSVILTH